MLNLLYSYLVSWLAEGYVRRCIHQRSRKRLEEEGQLEFGRLLPVGPNEEELNKLRKRLLEGW
jgi:hypothetical protein